MSVDRLSVKHLCLLIAINTSFSMCFATALLFLRTGDHLVLLSGLLLTSFTMLWFFVGVRCFSQRLTSFTNELCRLLDDMINMTSEPTMANDSETLFARIQHRLLRLYDVMQASQCKVDSERLSLQTLVSDIAHQVKMPISNLKMVTDTLLTRPLSEQERSDFLQAMQSQTDKLDFLLQALVKTSRLETGAITLVKKEGLLFDTLAQALSGIVYSAEKKALTIIVDCPDDLHLCHDSKWTAEALFNLLDNAVKYTSPGGTVSVSVAQWEMYVKLDITDTGKGIAESEQATIFHRFYRTEDVHDTPGIGIGLYLARQIITSQGGYIQVTSKVGEGATFSVFLPWQ